MYAVAASIIAFLFASASYAGSLGGGTYTANGDYTSFVVFGDLQRMMDNYRTGGSGSAGYSKLSAAVDWIFANRDRERIEFVMAVGDLINSAVALPPTGDEASACDSEEGAPYVASSATCVAFVADETSCKAEPGCFWKYDSDGDGDSCGSCELVARAQTEWTGFDALWARFEPGGDTTDGIPALLVRGNHDNVGTQNAVDTDREPLGWNDRYGQSYWSALSNQYGGRFYQHVATYDDDTTGDNHAWFVKLGGRQILVVSIACCTATGVPDEAEAWALAVMALYPEFPAIVLTHHANAIESIVVNSADTEAPNLWAYFGGHDGDRLKTIRTIGSKKILRSETDWTTASGTPSNDFDETRTVRNDYFTLVRVYASTDEIDVLDFSVEGNARSIRTTNRVDKQPLSIDPL